MAANGMYTRIKRGWRLGLSEGDNFVRIGTLIVVLLMLLFGYKSCIEEKPRAQRAMPGRTGVAGPLAPGTMGWVTHVGAEINPTPRASQQARRAFPFQPVVVAARSPDGQWLRVDAIYASGERYGGWISAQRVTPVNPGTGAQPEAGWVVVTENQGAPLRIGPDVNSETHSAAPKGQILRKIGRLRRSGAQDFLLVENLGPGGRLGPAWVFGPTVAASGPPAGKR